MIKKVEAAKLEISQPAYQDKYKEAGKRHQKFIEYLSDEKNLRELIIAKPAELKARADKIFNILNHDDIYTSSKGVDSQTEFGKFLIEKIFDYSAYRSGAPFIKIYLTQLKLKSLTCPYCNFVPLEMTAWKDVQGDKQKAYLDLDHFYSKCRFPFFALSFYNLIPCCHYCNATAKGTKLFDVDSHIHPYHQDFDDHYIFDFDLDFWKSDGEAKVNLNTKKGGRPDKLAHDLSLHPRLTNDLKETVNLVAGYHKYANAQITAREKEILFDLIGATVPFKKCEILGYQKGKLNRDVLKSIDAFGILNIA